MGRMVLIFDNLTMILSPAPRLWRLPGLMVRRSDLLVELRPRLWKLWEGLKTKNQFSCVLNIICRAEAESMRMKASAYKQYEDAAIMSLVLEALPQIAAEVAAPLAKTDEIVLIGGSDRTTDEINKLVGSLPPAIQALSGVDITGALGKIPGAVMTR